MAIGNSRSTQTANSKITKNLSKAFDGICHDLLVAKQHSYGLSLPALKMTQDYLLNQK